MVVAWGGDGTVNEVASSLAFRRRAWPSCRRARATGWPASWACRWIRARLRRRMAGVDRRIDLGSLDGRIFVNVAGMGLDARVA